MISHLSIQNFAIIQDMSVDFEQGLQIITGETGAGKSIIIQAIHLALGSRADTSYIRTGEDRARIQLVLDVKAPSLVDFLKENNIEDPDQLFITREIYTSGKSICKLNGEMVSVSFLSKICSRLADIHGQYDHQSLLHPERHIHLVDACCAGGLADPKAAMRAAFEAYANARQELIALSAKSDEKQRRQDFLQYELDEILAANLSPGEDETLEAHLTLLQNSEKILSNVSLAYEQLTGEAEGNSGPVAQALRHLEQIAPYDKKLQDFTAVLSDCYYRLEDLSGDLRRYRDAISFSQEEINDTITRLDIVNALKRKHGGSIENVLAHAESVGIELSAYQNSETRINELKKMLPNLEKQLTYQSRQVSTIRKKTALSIEKKIQVELSELNFSNAGLRIAFHKTDTPEGRMRFTENGIDDIEFMISTNRGEPHKPLSKIASGGEISRIMLAFKRIIGDYDDMPCLIFDEIDTGISGSSASIVGRKLLAIAENRQVICITHLPQVAAFGDQNYKIIKEARDGQTFTGIRRLSEPEKVDEIARMLGGLAITSSALQNAQDLISQSRPDKT